MKVAMLIAGLLMLVFSMFEAWAVLEEYEREKRKGYVRNARFAALVGFALLSAQAFI